MKIRKIGFAVTLLILFSRLFTPAALAQTTAFSYQGRLNEVGSPVTGTRYFRFTLYDETGAAIPGATVEQTLTVTNGTFNTSLVFGAGAFPGANRSLEIAVKTNAGDAYTILNPRQDILSTPYSIKSKAAENSNQLGGLDSTRYVQQDASGNVGIGTLSPTQRLEVNGIVRFTPGGSGGAIQFGSPNTETGMTISGAAGRGDLRFDGSTLKLVASASGIPPSTNGVAITTAGNVGIGGSNPTMKLSVTAGSSLEYAVAAFINGNNKIALFGANSDSLGFAGYFSGRLHVEGPLSLNPIGLGVAGGTPLCLNAANVIAACSSSQRYKDNVQPMRLGLSLIRRLRPVTFNWKESRQPDLGLIAEEVAAVEPSLATHNHKGEVEGVKYQQLTVVLINAVNEQQAQLETQAKQIAEQQTQLQRQQQQLDALRRRSVKPNRKPRFVPRGN